MASKIDDAMREECWDQGKELYRKMRIAWYWQMIYYCIREKVLDAGSFRNSFSPLQRQIKCFEHD